ncbi:MAG: hypothetical protein WB988_25960 [Candidatus Nitrosopolaris sp.]|jgi:hypothetical protein
MMNRLKKQEGSLGDYLRESSLIYRWYGELEKMVRKVHHMTMLIHSYNYLVRAHAPKKVPSIPNYSTSSPGPVCSEALRF